MTDLIKLAIVDGDPQVINDIKKHFTETGVFEVVGTATEGNRGLDMLQTLDVDVLICDLVLHNLDGIFLMEKVAEKSGKTPLMIGFSSIYLNSWVHHLSTLGAMFIRKPFNYNLMAERILDQWNARINSNKYGFEEFNLELTPITTSPLKPKPPSPKAYVNQLLNKMGAPASLSGRVYLQTAFLMVLERTDSIQGHLMNNIYPNVAKAHGSNTPSVERAVRYLIERTMDKKYMKEEFVKLGMYGMGDNKRPTVSEFLMSLVQCYDQEYGVN